MQAPSNIFLRGLGLVCAAAFLALSATDPLEMNDLASRADTSC